MTIDEQIDFMEESLRKLKAQYDLFLMGMRKTPPTTDRARLDALVHELSKMRIRDNGRRFRLSTLTARYNQYREMWSRKMREREEGPMDFRRRKAALSAAAEMPPPPPPERSTPSARETSAVPESYVKVTQSADGAAMKQLYTQLVDENLKAGKMAGLTPEQVAAMVQKQADALRAKYGVEAVAFRFETVEGKVKLKARPIQERP